MLIEEIRKAWEEADSVRDQIFENENAPGINAERAVFEHVTFRKCVLAGGCFEGAEFMDVFFEDCDLGNCSFKNTYFKNARFMNCKADGSNFAQASLKQVRMERCGFSYVNFGSSLWENTVTEDCVMREAFCSEVKFKKPVFHRVDLTAVDFFRTKLKGINLSDCGIGGIQVSDTYAELAGVKVNVVQAAELAKLLRIQIV